MKRKILLLLILSLFLSGCCYAPGNERTSFIEHWLQLPPLKMEEYHSSKVYPENDSTDPSDPNQSDVLADPEINLEDMPKRADADFVKVRDYIPDIVTDLKYATTANFTGTVIYDFTEVYLRYSTVIKLMEVQKELRQQGLRLKIWDGFRPLDAQQKLWDAKPDPVYVSNPKTGTNSHSRGHTLDVTLVNRDGKELEMPTGFDDFTTFADRDYSDCTNTAASNAMLLPELMEKHGFRGLQTEWWHFTEDKTDYPIEQVFDPGAVSLWRAQCNEYINMRTSPNVSAGVIDTIENKVQFTVLGWVDGFAFIEYKDQRGYVNADYISRVE